MTAGGLVFIGATNDSRFRAFDKDTGKELWVTQLPASAHATPDDVPRAGRSGRQFVVIAAGGGNKYNKVFSDSLIAFALPADADDTPLVSYSRNSGRESVASRPAAAAAIGRGIYSHARHASSGMDCAACHKSATTGERAGFPRTSECLRCHLGATRKFGSATAVGDAGIRGGRTGHRRCIDFPILSTFGTTGMRRPASLARLATAMSRSRTRSGRSCR